MKLILLLNLSIPSMDRYLPFQFKKLFFIEPKKGIRNAVTFFIPSPIGIETSGSFTSRWEFQT